MQNTSIAVTLRIVAGVVLGGLFGLNGLVVGAAAEKPHAQHHGCGDISQRLVEIGAVLFTDREQIAMRNARPLARGKAVEIADDRLGHMPRRQRPGRTAVGGDQVGRTLKRQSQIVPAQPAAADQGYWLRNLHNRRCHAGINARFGNRTQSGHEMIRCPAQIRAAFVSLDMVNRCNKL